MRKLPILSFPFIFLAGLAAAAGALAAERTVPCNTLPKPIQDYSATLVKQGATIRSCVKDVTAGKTTYELETQTAAGTRDITLSGAGAVLEIEEEVSQGKLPSAVAEAFKKASESGSLKKIESVTRGGKVVSYEAVVEKGGKRREVAVHANGTPMKAD